MINLTVDFAKADATALENINLVLLQVATYTYVLLLLEVKGPM